MPFSQEQSGCAKCNTSIQRPCVLGKECRKSEAAHSFSILQGAGLPMRVRCMEHTRLQRKQPREVMGSPFPHLENRPYRQGWPVSQKGTHKSCFEGPLGFAQVQSWWSIHSTRHENIISSSSSSSKDFFSGPAAVNPQGCWGMCVAGRKVLFWGVLSLL